MLLRHKSKKEGLDLILIVIIVINVLVFAVEYANGDIRNNDYFYSIGGFRYSNNVTLDILRRSIMCQFIHQGFWHLSINTISFIILVKELKRSKSTLYIIGIYIWGLAIVAGTLICFGREGITYLGNSGAIYALLGSYLYINYIKGRKGKIDKEGRDFIFIIIITSLLPNISILMHLSGILSGIILSMIISN